MRIARVFPTRTSMSPTDWDAYFGPPDLFTPTYDAIHVSVLFTWDIVRAEQLKREWEKVAPVTIGGPAICGESMDSFIPGEYVRRGCVITSRGCPNRCQWCFIRQPLVELDIHRGNNILDNNILACSPAHLDAVFQMLADEKEVKFTGGLEADRITDGIAERLRSLRLQRVYLAYDHLSHLSRFRRAAMILRKYLSREQVSAYVLIGYGDDTLDGAEGRLRETWEAGVMPFAMLYRDKKGSFPSPEKEWRRFQRSWCRPAAIRAIMSKAIADYKEEK